MNLAIICNVTSKEPLGVIGVDKDKKLVGYMTNDNDLENILEIILDNNTIELPVKETIDNSEILRYEQLDCTNSYYLIALNYHLPYPYKMLGVTYAEGELETLIQESFEHMEGVKNEGFKD